MYKSFKSIETIEKILNIIKNKERGAYLRFGDGDFNIMNGKNEQYNKFDKNLSKELIESLLIDNENYMIGLPLICDKYGLLEKGMFPGNHEWPEKNADVFYNNACNARGKPIINIYTYIAFNYLITTLQDSSYIYIKNLRDLCKTNNVLFIGNKNINKNILNLLFENYTHIYCPDVNSYSCVNDIEKNIINSIDSNKYNIIIICSGITTRAIIKRLWVKNINNIFMLDLGSVIDALSGIDSRAYIKLTNFNHNKYIENLKIYIANNENNKSNKKILVINNNYMHRKNLTAILNYNLDITMTDKINESEFEKYDIIFSPYLPIDVKKYQNKKFIFGPQFSVFPVMNQINLINNVNSTYIILSDWVKNIWEKKIKLSLDTIPLLMTFSHIPFGVDTNRFSPKNNEKKNIFIYFKRRNPEELNYVCNFLDNIGEKTYKIFDYVKKYSENEYIDYLQNSKYGIWIGSHESQGFALQEALSCDVPLLVWNVTSMKQEFKSTYDDIPATSIPYWDNRCGEYFTKQEEFLDIYKKFITNLDNYKPRDYVLENLSFDVCKQKFLEII